MIMTMKRFRITRGGQISMPAHIRHRWNASAVTIEDRGDEVVVRPAPEDPVAAFRGSLAGPGAPDVAALRAGARREEQEIEDRRGH